MRCAQSSDGVHHQQCVCAFYQACDSFHIVPDAGGTLRGLHVEHSVIGREFFAHLLRRYRLAIRRAHGLELAVVGFGQALPSLAKLSRGNDQHFIAGRSQVGHRSFHCPRAGRGEHHHVILCADKNLQIGQHSRV